MKNNKEKYTEPIVWSVYIATTILFRFITPDDVPLSAWVLFFLTLCVLLWISLYKHRYELLGIKYNFVFGTAVTLWVINVFAIIVLGKYHPEILEEHNTLGGIISLFFFLVLVGVIIVGAEKMKNKRN